MWIRMLNYLSLINCQHTSKSQFGFTKSKSTEDALLEFTNYIKKV